MDKDEMYPLQILLLEDEEDVNTDYKNKIENIPLDTFKVVVNNFTDYETALKFLNKNSVNLIVTDKNLSEDKNGEDLLKHLEEGTRLPEAIFYSSGKITEIKDLKEKGVTFVSFAVDNLIDTVEKKLNLISKKFKNQTFLRGFFITEFVGLELQINEFLYKYFLNREDKDKKLNEEDENKKSLFNDYLLESKYNSFENKSEVLSEIVKSEYEKYKNGIVKSEYEKYKKKISKEKLGKLASNRNKIAHSPFKDNAFVTHNKKNKITEKEIKVNLREIGEIKKAINDFAETIKESPKDKK